jgi:hypothetical protein
MNDHLWFEENLPLFVNGQLTQEEFTKMQLHLDGCSRCREELALWQSISQEVIRLDETIPAPLGLTAKVLQPTHRRHFPLIEALRHAWQLLKMQTPLVRQDMWLASVGMMAIGVAVAVITKRSSLIYFLAPLIAAAMLTLIYGPENDLASELTRATPTSPAMVLFARLTLVSVFNLALGMIASLTVSVLLPGVSFWILVLTWLEPMAFLSMLALFLSLWMGSGNAVFITYGLWVIQYIPFQQIQLLARFPAWMQKLTILQTFWGNTPFLIIGTLSLLVLSLVCTRFTSLSVVRQSA